MADTENEGKIIWYLAILGGSFMPELARLIATMDFPRVSNFDVKDLLFSGLAMTLSNFNLVGSKKVKYKVMIFGFSGACVFVNGLIIGIFLMNEIAKTENSLTNLTYFSEFLVLICIIVSYITNRFVFTKPIKK